MLFRDRRAAGRRLAEKLGDWRDRDPVVLALPRGGVPVAAEIAAALNAPLDLLLVRKIGAPGEPELAVGAVVDGERADLVVDETLAEALAVPSGYFETQMKRQLAEIERRRRVYLEGRRPVEIRGRTAIVVDDGIATGSTVRVALRALRRRDPAAIILAVPVAPAATLEALRPEVTDIVCLETPADFEAIGAFYDDFAQLRDETVVQLLREADQRHRSAAPEAPAAAPAAPEDAAPHLAS